MSHPGPLNDTLLQHADDGTVAESCVGRPHRKCVAEDWPRRRGPPGPPARPGQDAAHPDASYGGACLHRARRPPTWALDPAHLATQVRGPRDRDRYPALWGRAGPRGPRTPDPHRLGGAGPALLRRRPPRPARPVMLEGVSRPSRPVPPRARRPRRPATGSGPPSATLGPRRLLRRGHDEMGMAAHRLPGYCWRGVDTGGPLRRTRPPRVTRRRREAPSAAPSLTKLRRILATSATRPPTDDATRMLELGPPLVQGPSASLLNRMRARARATGSPAGRPPAHGR